MNTPKAPKIKPIFAPDIDLPFLELPPLALCESPINSCILIKIKSKNS